MTVTAMLAVAGLVLAGCSGQDQVAAPPLMARPKAVTPSAVNGPPATKSAAEALAAVPLAARAHTNAGAQAFTEFYLGQLNEAWRIPDPEALRPYATTGCKTCANYRDTATFMKQTGQRYSGPPVEVTSVAWLPESTPARAVVSVGAFQAARAVVREDGKTIRRVERAPSALEVEVIWRDHRWLMDKVFLFRMTK